MRILDSGPSRDAKSVAPLGVIMMRCATAVISGDAVTKDAFLTFIPVKIRGVPENAVSFCSVIVWS